MTPLAEEEKIICEVCDAEIPADSKKCPVCGASLTEKEDESEDESLDDVMEYIIGEDDDEEILDKIKTIGSSTDETASDSFLEGEVLEGEMEEHLEKTTTEYEEEKVEEEVEFECPVCGTVVSADDSKCPNCGAIFETEEKDLEKMEELEIGIDRVESELDDLKGSEIDLTYLNNGLNDLIDSYEESRYEEGLEILDVVETQLEDIKEIIDLINLSEKHLKAISEGKDTTAFEKRLDVIIDDAEVGEYKSSLKKAKALKDELEELKSEHTEEEEEIKNELEKKIEDARTHLSEVRGKRIDISDIKEYMKDAVSAKKDDNFSDGISNSEEVIERSEKVLKIIDLIDEGKGKIKEMKNREMSYEPYLDRLKEGKSKADESEYEQSIETLTDVTEDMKEVLEGTEEEIEEVKEEVEKEESEEEKELSDELNNLIKQGKKNYNKVKKSNLSVRSVKDYFKDAVKAKKEGDFEKGIEKVKEGNERSEKILEISEIIDEARSKIKTLKEEDIDHKEYLNRLKEAKKLGDEGDYEGCREETESVIKEIENALEEAAEKEEKKEKRAELNEEIEELKDEFDRLTEKANELYLNIEGPIKTKKSALEKREDGDLEECISELEEANKKIHDAIDEEIEEKLMELELNLEDAWDDETKQEAEDLIEEIRNKIEKRQYEDIDELMEKAKDKTQNAMGPISKIEEEISNTEDLIFEGKILEFDVSDAEAELEEAKDELDVGDWEEAEKHLETARSNLGDKLPEILKSDLKKSREELREAKIKGIDISKAVSSIKEVKNARRDGELTKAFQKYQDFKEEMDKIKDQY